jgi:hypothetical protein
MAWPKRLNGAGLCADRIFGTKATNRATEIDDKLSTKNVNQFTLGLGTMHHRVTAWVIACCAAPVLMVLSTVAVMLLSEGFSALLVAVFWQGLLGFLFLTLSLAVLSPVLLLPSEKTPLNSQSRTVVLVLAAITGLGLIVSLLAGSLALSILAGVLFDAAVYILALPRPNNTVERDGPQAARPSL